MKKTAIEIQNLSKIYRIREKDKKVDFSALQNLNFDVPRGQVLGIIGANGAGKSTLLKILSRITFPTSGQALVHGRLASLLEVGTGFHPELSGRENIFLNGSILGMTRREIKSRFDEIVDFSGVEKFLDTPVKHYSSGMYVRLAFSVAAHLTAEVLLIDEVLAVGDAEFQQKCLQKMDETSEADGRTVLFVSHNLSAVRQLCERVIWLRSGEIVEDSEAESVTSSYLKNLDKKADEVPIEKRKDRVGSGEVIVSKILWKTNNEILISGKPAKLVLSYHSIVEKPIENLNFRINIFKQNGEFLSTLSNEWFDTAFKVLPSSGKIECRFQELPLLSGDYYLTTNLFINKRKIDKVEKALNFSVEEGDFQTKGALKTRKRSGVLMNQEWSFHKAEGL